MKPPQTSVTLPGRMKAVASVVAFIGACALVACGGGSSEDDVTRSDFIADADAICAQFNVASTAREADFNEALKASDLEQAATDFEDQANEANAMLDQIAAIEVPVSDQATVDDIILIGRQRADAATEAADAIAAGDKEAMIAAGRKASDLAGQYFQMTDGFGFVDCGSGSSAGTSGSGNSGTTGTTS